jgi:nucleotide-binding universal stress UspA family protein
MLKCSSASFIDSTVDCLFSVEHDAGIWILDRYVATLTLRPRTAKHADLLRRLGRSRICAAPCGPSCSRLGSPDSRSHSRRHRSSHGVEYRDMTDIAYDRIESAAQLVLREALDLTTRSGLMAAGHVAFGNVVDSIVTHADLLNADVIVVGHRTRRGLARWWRASPTTRNCSSGLQGAP